MKAIRNICPLACRHELLRREPARRRRHLVLRFAEQTLRAAITWGRFAEAFAYDEAAGVFSLDNPV